MVEALPIQRGFYHGDTEERLEKERLEGSKVAWVGGVEWWAAVGAVSTQTARPGTITGVGTWPKVAICEALLEWSPPSPVPCSGREL